MLLQLTDHSPEPMHSQIGRQILNKIIHGDLCAGETLAPIRKMAREQKVNIFSVQRAYQDLIKDGLLKYSKAGFRVVHLSNQQKKHIAQKRHLETMSPLNIVQNFSRKLVSVFDPPKLRLLLYENLKTFLDIININFILYENISDNYILLNESNEFLIKVAIDDPLLIKVMQTKKHILLDSLHISKSLLFEKLFSTHKCMLFPIFGDQQFIGMFALSMNDILSEEEINLVHVLINQFVAALTTAQFYVETIERQRIKDEIKIARRIQEQILPPKIYNNHSVKIAAHSNACGIIGGDIYDYFEIDKNRCAFLVADACGHGLASAMLISQIHAALRAEIKHGSSMQNVMKMINKQVKQCAPKNSFVSLFYGELDYLNLTFTYANAGHNFPICMHKDGSYYFINSNSPALGLFDNYDFDISKVHIQKNDIILMYTDGIIEAMNNTFEQYGEARIIQNLSKTKHLEPEAILDTINKNLMSFVNNNKLADDMTLLLFKVK